MLHRGRWICSWLRDKITKQKTSVTFVCLVVLHCTHLPFFSNGERHIQVWETASTGFRVPEWISMKVGALEHVLSWAVYTDMEVRELNHSLQSEIKHGLNPSGTIIRSYSKQLTKVKIDRPVDDYKSQIWIILPKKSWMPLNTTGWL